jgi:RNA-directed DNA polymerase
MQLNQKWHQINWRNAYDYVAKLQKELVVAFKKNDWEKVYFLQNKLMMSFEGRAVSVRKVVSNKGRNSRFR